ncbi:MAG: TonB-dependent receptor [Bryobacteraceae bacterium]
MRHSLLAAVFICGTLPSTWAQTVLGSILGTVRDPTGASVPGVSITVRNVRTGISNKAATNDDGDYTAPLLAAGEYEITAEMRNFKTLRQTGIVLQVAQRQRVDLTLQVGEVTQAVSVEARAVLVNTESPEISQVISNRSVVELPLNGREFVQLVQLAPGANAGPPGAAAGVSLTPGAGASLGTTAGTASLGGASTESLGFLLDGVENTDRFQHAVGIRPTIDSIQEFRVQDKLMPAEFGQTTAGTISAITKSGTNDFRGTLWEFLRNDKLDARSFFDAKKPVRRRNQYGFVLGGPVLIPKAYNGKNRSFFFVSYEGTRLRSATTAFGTVPTEAMKQGDFGGAVPGGQLYDPFSLGADGLRTPFAGNLIPQSRRNATSAQLLQFYPAANLPTTSPDPNRVINNYTKQLVQAQDVDQILVRIDHSLSANDRLFGRFSYADDFAPNFGLLPFADTSVRTNARSGAVGYTHVFGPSMVNELKLAYLRRRPTLSPESLFTQRDFNQRFGFQSREPGVPPINVTGFSSLGSGVQLFDLPLNDYGVYESLSHIRGRHNLKFGFQYSRVSMNNAFADIGGGGRSFNGNFTRQIGTPNNALEGRGFADFLMGVASSVGGLNVDTSADRHRPRFSFYSAYAQDDWKVTNNLTLNIGVRYDLFLPPYTTNGRSSSWFDFATGELVYPSNAPVTFPQPWPGRKTSGKRLTSTDYTDLAGRFGFAYRVGGNNKTVVRGGYGIYYDPGVLNVAFNNSQAPPFFKTTSLSTNPDERNPANFLSITRDVAPANVPLALPVTFKSYMEDTQSGMMQQWSLSIERQFGDSLVAGVAYVGWKADHFLWDNVINFPPPGPGNPQDRRPYRAFGSNVVQMSNGSSNMEALQAKLEKRFSHGLSFLSGFSWQHTIGNQLTENGSDIWIRLQQYGNLRAERGDVEYDVRTRFTLSAVYELPFGKSLGGMGKQVLRGWQTGVIYAAQGGYVATPRVSSDNTNRGARSAQYANTNGTQANLPRGQKTRLRWFDTSPFSIPAQFTFGNVGRSTIRTNGMNNVDLSVSKNFFFDDIRRLQFRAEFFNLGNRTQFAVPNMFVDSPAFGQVTRAFSFGRQIQVALKFHF